VRLDEVDGQDGEAKQCRGRNGQNLQVVVCESVMAMRVFMAMARMTWMTSIQAAEHVGCSGFGLACRSGLQWQPTSVPSLPYVSYAVKYVHTYIPTCSC
jgi:hypothetical protein